MDAGIRPSGRDAVPISSNCRSFVAASESLRIARAGDFRPAATRLTALGAAIMKRFAVLTLLALAAAGANGQVLRAQQPAAPGADAAEVAQIKAGDEAWVKAFDAGNADAVASAFLPKGELIDEEGVVYQGQAEIKELLTKFFTKFPGAKLTLSIESIRLVGPVAIEEGTRYTTTKEGQNRAQVRYIAVRTKTASGWQIASLRDFPDDPPPTANERLAPVAFLVGDWVNEGTDGVVKISYRWAEDKNFILGDFLITRGGQVAMKSTQRIGWDPLAGKVRSWMFDSDGGYAEALWTQIEDAWVMKSSAVMPDGLTGSATITLTPLDKDRYTLKGTERIVGDERDDDFEFVVARAAPAAAAPAAAPRPAGAAPRPAGR